MKHTTTMNLAKETPGTYVYKAAIPRGKAGIPDTLYIKKALFDDPPASFTLTIEWKDASDNRVNEDSAARES